MSPDAHTINTVRPVHLVLCNDSGAHVHVLHLPLPAALGVRSLQQSLGRSEWVL